MNEKTYCILSHVGIFNRNPSQDLYPCCGFEPDNSNFVGNKKFITVSEWFDSDYYKYVTTNLDNGNALPECNFCWTKEGANLISFRQNNNQTLVSKNWLNVYQKNKTSFLLFADINVDNICNYACLMCDPSGSSKIYNRWIQNTNVEHIEEKLKTNPQFLKDSRFHTLNGNYELFDQVLSYKPRLLKISGGEPLLNKTLINKLISYQHKSQTRLGIVTNGSIDLVETYEKLKDYKSINFTVSLDGFEIVNDYIRLHSNWDFIKNNILNAKKHGISILVHIVIQSVNLQSLPILLDWLDTIEIDYDFYYLNSPWQLSCDVLPTEYFKNCLKNIKNDNLVDFIKNNYIHKPDKIKNLTAFINWYERDSQLKLKDVNCSLSKILSLE